MATDITYHAAAYAVLVNESGQVWDNVGTAWVAAETSGTYDADTVLTLALQTGVYAVAIPSGAAETWVRAVLFNIAAPAFDAIAVAVADAPKVDLVAVDGKATNFGRAWYTTLADLWAGIRGTSSGPNTTQQTHEYADGTDAFTVSNSSGNRTFS